MSGEIRAVVFDLGNVCITWDRRLLYRQFFDDEAELEHFLTEVYSMEVNERFDRGMPLAELTAELAARHPRYEREVLALADRWIETIGPVIDGTIAILAELRARSVPLYALSNWNAETFALVEPHHEFLGWFDGIVISGREGVTKPDPAIYRLLCERHGLAPQHALFVDDSPANVEGARATGMPALRFADASTLRAELVAVGLLAPRQVG
jgi:2-haloacid dehalogenase